MFMNRFDKLMNKLRDSLEYNRIAKVAAEYHMFEKFCRGHHRILSHLVRHIKAGKLDIHTTEKGPEFKFDVDKTLRKLQIIIDELFILGIEGPVSNTMTQEKDIEKIKKCFADEVGPRVAAIQELLPKIERHVRKYLRIIRNEIIQSKRLLDELEKVEQQLEDFE